MKKAFLLIASFLLLSVVIYYVDYAADTDHLDCFDNKVNHILIFCGVMILALITIICFLLFYKFDNDKIEKE
ncbi:MAG: hypothetical protein J0L87_03685 [Bacteroidetes bacterium]|nr:hypothetical protein [Bacteroidota bacterium]